MNRKLVSLAIVPFAALGIGLAACSSSAAPAVHHHSVQIHAQPHRAMPRPPVVVHHAAKPKAVVRPPEPVAPAQHAPAPEHCGAVEALYHGKCVNDGTNSCVQFHDCAPLLPGQKPAPGQSPAPQPPVNPDPNDVPNAQQQATCCNANGVAYCCGG